MGGRVLVSGWGACIGPGTGRAGGGAPQPPVELMSRCYVVCRQKRADHGRSPMLTASNWRESELVTSRVLPFGVTLNSRGSAPALASPSSACPPPRAAAVSITARPHTPPLPPHLLEF